MTPRLVPPPKSYLDPCPCGSGKKYMNCCWEKWLIWERPKPEMLTPQAVEAARQAAVWQIGWMPFPNCFERAHYEIWGSFLIVASGHVLCAPTAPQYEMAIHDRARKMAAEIEWISYHVGSSPAVIWNRHLELVDALRPLLSEQGIAVAWKRDLADLDQAALKLHRHTTELLGDQFYNMGARVWSALDQDEGWLEESFDTLADLYLLHPWNDLESGQCLLIEEPEKPDWFMDFRGTPVPCLWIFGDPDDRFRLARSENPYIPSLYERAYGVIFSGREMMISVTAEEIEQLGLRLAGQSAYPRFIMLNTPACILPRGDGRRLLRTFQAFNRVWPELREWHRTGGDLESVDESSDIRFTFRWDI